MANIKMTKINDLPLLSNPTEDMYCLVGKEDLHKVPWSAIMGQIGAPYIATTVAGMTDKTRVYVYQGSESGYTSGNWYYWNGSAWTSGGIYNSAAVDTDKTLTQSDKPADSAVVGKEIGSLKEYLDDVLVDNVENLLNFKNIEYQSKPDDLKVTIRENSLQFEFSGSDELIAFIPVKIDNKCYFLFKKAYRTVSESSAGNISNIRLFASDKSKVLYSFADINTEQIDYKYLFANTTKETNAYVRIYANANGAKYKNTLIIQNLWAINEEDEGKNYKVLEEKCVKKYLSPLESKIIKNDGAISNNKKIINSISELNLKNLVNFSGVEFEIKPSDLSFDFTETSITLKGTGTIVAWIPLNLMTGNNYYFKIKKATGTVNGTNTNVRIFNNKNDDRYLKELLRFSDSEYDNVEVRYPSSITGGYLRIWTANTYNEITLEDFWCKTDETKDIEPRIVIKKRAIDENTLKVYDVEKYSTPYTLAEDTICSYIRGIDFANELNTSLTDFKKEGDLMVHVSTFAIINDVVYMTYYANRTHATETPSEHIARFAYCSINDLGNKTFIDLQSVGDTFNAKKVSAIYDTILLRKDDDVLYLMWTAIVDGVYTRLYRTYTISTNTLSDVFENNYKVGNQVGKFNITNMTRLMNGMQHKTFTGDIGIMQRLTSRIENGETYYYTGAYCGEWNAIIKSKDLITWEYVSHPSFENKSQWENAVYVKGDYAYYFLRQLSTESCGILTRYNLNNDTWDSPVYINDCQSRSDFFVRYNVLYLLHAPKSREYLSIMRIDENELLRSYDIQTAHVNDFFYPYVQEYKGQLYMSFTNSRQHIYLSKFSLLKESNDSIREKIKKLIN